MSLIVNALTHINIDPSHTVGSFYENEYFKVIPLTTDGSSPEKLFFTNYDEYDQWQQLFYQKIIKKGK
jgi:hypothetical protein